MNKPTTMPDLAARAAKLWPESQDLQKRWMRAVELVRKTTNGWLLERRVGRLQ